MGIQKATGIVLSSREINESDVLSTILTREQGKRKFIFKGLKKSRKRPIHASEPGTVVQIVYYFKDSREFHVINDFTVMKHYDAFRNDIEKIYCLYYILESVDRTTGFNSDETPVFDLLAAGMDTLSKTEFPAHLAAFFILHLLRLHGILPDMNRCHRCGSVDYRAFSFDTAELTPVCSSCGNAKISLDGSIAIFLKKSTDTRFTDIMPGNYSHEMIINLIYYMTSFMENYFHNEIKSKKFILS